MLFITKRDKESDSGKSMGSCDEGEGADDSSTVLMEELAITVDRLNRKKVAGINIPRNIIKLIYKYRPHDLLNTINNSYNLGKMPRKWKTGRVILLTKPGKDPLLPNRIGLSVFCHQ